MGLQHHQELQNCQVSVRNLQNAGKKQSFIHKAKGALLSLFLPLGLIFFSSYKLEPLTYLSHKIWEGQLAYALKYAKLPELAWLENYVNVLSCFKSHLTNPKNHPSNWISCPLKLTVTEELTIHSTPLMASAVNLMQNCL